jgi:hypothetical protein
MDITLQQKVRDTVNLAILIVQRFIKARKASKRKRGDRDAKQHT